MSSDGHNKGRIKSQAKENEILSRRSMPSPRKHAHNKQKVAQLIQWPLMEGVELRADLIAIAGVYLVQGVLGLSRLAVQFHLKDTLQVSPASAGIVMNVGAVPWLVKPLWGFLSDSLPIFGARRKPYLALSGLLGALGWVGMAEGGQSQIEVALYLLMSGVGTAVSDVIIDALVVERSRGESQGTTGSLQSLCWGSSAVGGVASAYFSGSLVEQYGARPVFLATAAFPLLTAFSALLVEEDESKNPRAASCREKEQHLEARVHMPTETPGEQLQSLEQRSKLLWQVVTDKRILLPTLFVLLYRATPSPDSALFYFQTNRLGFDAEFLGKARLVSSIASLTGVLIFNNRLKTVSLKKIFKWCSILSCGLGLTQLLLVTRANVMLGISDRAFALTDSAVLSVLGQVSFMPTLVLAARICPEGVEATLFAGLMSTFNAGGVASGLLGSGLTQLLGITMDNFDKMWLLILLCNTLNLAPLPYLHLLDQAAQIDPSTNDRRDEDGSNPRAPESQKQKL